MVGEDSERRLYRLGTGNRSRNVSWRESPHTNRQAFSICWQTVYTVWANKEGHYLWLDIGLMYITCGNLRVGYETE